MTLLNPAYFLKADYQQAHQVKQSLAVDTIVAIALSALAFIAASVFDRHDPVLAILLRCAPVGIALIWLFNRCLQNNNHSWRQQNGLMSGVVVQSPPSPVGSWFGGDSYFRKEYNHRQSSNGFPSSLDNVVMRQAPPNREEGSYAGNSRIVTSRHKPMYQAPMTRNEPPTIHEKPFFKAPETRKS